MRLPFKALIFAVSLLLLPASAQAQGCSGTMASGQVCANSSAVERTPFPTTETALLDRWCSSTPGSIPSRGASTWGCSTTLPTTAFANPTASVGLTVVNGSAATAMRSDAAPALAASVQSALTGTSGNVLLGTGAFGFSSSGVGIGTSGANLGRLDTQNTWSASQALVLSQNADTFWSITNANAGATASGSFAVNNGTNSGGFGIGGLNNTGLGGLVGNRIFVNANAGSAGVLINTVNAVNIDFGIASTRVMRVSANPVLSITPAAATRNQGISISQTGPTSGSTTGSNPFNIISATNGATNTDATLDAWGLFNSNVSTLRVNMSVGGASLAGQTQNAILGAIRVTSNLATAIDKIGVIGAAYGNTIDNVGGQYFGGNFVVTIDSSANVTGMTGAEFDTRINAGATIQQRKGIAITNAFGVQQATAHDTAISLGSNSLGGEFKNFVIFSDIQGQKPLDNAATLFSADAAHTIANVFSMANTTISGNILDFPNMRLTGTGFGRFGSGGAPNTPVHAQIASGGYVQLNSMTNSVTGSDGIDMLTSTSSNEMIVAVNEAARTTVRYGITLGNYAEITSFTGNGLIIGTNNNVPFILGTNNVERIRLFGSGGLSYNNTADPGAAAVSFTGTFAVTSANASALAVGRLGATTPAFLVDASTATSITGVKIKAAASGGGVAVSAIGETNVNATYDAAGSGTFTIGGTSTGNIYFGRATAISTTPALTINTGVLLTINANTVALPAPTFSGTLLQLGGADATAPRIDLDAFTTANLQPSFAFRRHRGTAASRTTIASGDFLGAFFWDYYDGTGYNGSDAGQIMGFASGTISTSSHPTGFLFVTVPDGALAGRTGLAVMPSGGVSLTVGGSTVIPAVTLSQGEFGLPKMTASGAGPGAGFGKIALVCGTNAGTAKIIAYAGTSGTAVTVTDNIGTGVTGC